MAFSYLPCVSPPLRQGEIIQNLFELRPKVPSGENINIEQNTQLRRIDHSYAIVVSQDCDLDWDYKARQDNAQEHKLLSHVLLCALFPPNEIQYERGLFGSLYERTKQNQDERYHHFIEAPVGGIRETLPELYADFKATFSLPIDYVYFLTCNGLATRKGLLPSPYLQNFMHRLYNFLSRVAVPEIDQDATSSP